MISSIIGLALVYFMFKLLFGTKLDETYASPWELDEDFWENITNK